MASLIVGMGEVGNALHEVLREHYMILTLDENEEAEAPYKAAFGHCRIMPIDMMHICFPYSDDFVGEVKGYQQKHDPKYTIIHSTVPVGTSRLCGALHSPVKGVHPNLVEGLKIHTKFIGGEKAGEVADYFRRAGMKVFITDRQETTELAKIESTNYYGILIEKMKDTKRLFERYGLPFEFYWIWTKDYNEGMVKLGYPENQRPLLIPQMGKIGGHCVLPNAKFLDTPFTHLLRKLNEDESKDE